MSLRKKAVCNFCTLHIANSDKPVAFYNLDVIISVGYRVKSHRGTQVRIWGTKVLHEYLQKGFAMNDDLLKRAGGGNYFDELLARIRDIRSSEKLFYRKILEIYATSIDYEPGNKQTQEFFTTIQNKMHFSAHGKTAAEVIYQRVDSDKDFMGKYSELRTTTKVHSYLKGKGIITKYGILTLYINKNVSKFKLTKGINNSFIQKIIINRGDSIKTVFNWKCNDENIKNNIATIENLYPVITKYKNFYTTFKEALVKLDYKKVEKIFNTDFKDNTINKFLHAAEKDDYEAIINASKFKFNNGILERTVNKIKNIKKVMYGKCSVELLTAKVLY